MGEQRHERDADRHRTKPRALAENGERGRGGACAKAHPLHERDATDDLAHFDVTRRFWNDAARCAAALAFALLFSGCATTEPRPSNVPRGVNFFVTPVHPRSFDIVASGSRKVPADVLKDAWHKKATMVANGRRFRASSLVVHDTEYIVPGYGVTLPHQNRTVSGSITLVE